ncbi:MAG: hypothetical protein LBV42_05730 [Methanobrevibacter sp.]|nr:hypothetical protein [Methanobrevibacter sp.]
MKETKQFFFDKIKDTLINKNKVWLFTKEEYDINNLNEIINKNGENYDIEKVYTVPTSSTDLNYFDNVYLIH